MKAMKILIAAALSLSTMTALANGVISWDGFCERGNFIIAGVNCESSACTLKMQANGVVTDVETLTTTPISSHPVPAGSSTWWVEQNGVTTSDVLTISHPTNCVDL